jgi:hypothetical protein
MKLIAEVQNTAEGLRYLWGAVFGFQCAIKDLLGNWHVQFRKYTVNNIFITFILKTKFVQFLGGGGWMVTDH